MNELHWRLYHKLLRLLGIFRNAGVKECRTAKKPTRKGQNSVSWETLSQKQQKVSLLTDFKQMNPLSGKRCLCFERNLQVVWERGTGFPSQAPSASKHKRDIKNRKDCFTLSNSSPFWLLSFPAAVSPQAAVHSHSQRALGSLGQYLDRNPRRAF